MEPLTIISGAVLLVVLILFSVAYFLNSRQVGMNTIQGYSRKLGLFSILAILFESVLMEHIFPIHAIALVCAVALWIIGLLEDSKESVTNDKQV